MKLQYLWQDYSDFSIAGRMQTRLWESLVHTSVDNRLQRPFVQNDKEAIKQQMEDSVVQMFVIFQLWNHRFIWESKRKRRQFQIQSWRCLSGWGITSYKILNRLFKIYRTYQNNCFGWVTICHHWTVIQILIPLHKYIWLIYFQIESLKKWNQIGVWNILQYFSI